MRVSGSAILATTSSTGSDRRKGLDLGKGLRYSPAACSGVAQW